MFVKKLLSLTGLAFTIGTFSAHGDFDHNSTISMIRNHAANPASGIEGSWTTVQLSGLEASDACAGGDEGLGDMAYLSLPDSEEFMLSMLLSAYLGGHQVSARIDEGGLFAGYCRLTQLSIAPTAAVSEEPDEEILRFDHEDLIVAYTMDKISNNLLLDEGPYNINGNISGARKKSDGVVGSALSFDNKADKVDLGMALTPILSANDAQFSISVWLKIDSNQGFVRILTKSTPRASGNNPRQLVLQTDSQSNILFGWYGDNTGQVRRIAQGPKLTSGEWQHLIISYDGRVSGNNGLDRVQMYVNGSAVDASFYSNTGLLSAIYNGGGSLTLGGEAGDAKIGSVGFSGLIDQLRIFKRPLSAIEALHLYGEGS